MTISPNQRWVAATLVPDRLREQSKIVVFELKDDGTLFERVSFAGEAAAFGAGEDELFLAKAHRQVPIHGIGGGQWTDYRLFRMNVNDGGGEKLLEEEFSMVGNIAHSPKQNALYFSAIPKTGINPSYGIHRYDLTSGKLDHLVTGTFPEVSFSEDLLFLVSETEKSFHYGLSSYDIETRQSKSLELPGQRRYFKSPRSGIDGALFFLAKSNSSGKYELLEWSKSKELQVVLGSDNLYRQ